MVSQPEIGRSKIILSVDIAFKETESFLDSLFRTFFIEGVINLLFPPENVRSEWTSEEKCHTASVNVNCEDWYVDDTKAIQGSNDRILACLISELKISFTSHFYDKLLPLYYKDNIDTTGLSLNESVDAQYSVVRTSESLESSIKKVYRDFIVLIKDKFDESDLHESIELLYNGLDHKYRYHNRDIDQIVNGFYNSIKDDLDEIVEKGSREFKTIILQEIEKMILESRKDCSEPSRLE